MLTQWHIFIIMLALRCIFNPSNNEKESDDNEWYVTLAIMSVSIFVYWLLAGWLVEPLNMILFDNTSIDIPKGASLNEYDNPKKPR